MAMTYDALLIVSFGGPEGPADVIPFLENVLRGRNVPRERMLEVAAHYDHFDGVSPINAQVRELIAALQLELDRSGIALPIYWGNRNWKPLLPDTLRQMAADGVQKGLAFLHLRTRLIPAVVNTVRTSRRLSRKSARKHRRSTSCEPSSTIPDSSPPMRKDFETQWRRFPRAVELLRLSCSPRTAFRSRWLVVAGMRPSYAKPAGWSLRRRVLAILAGSSSTKVVAAARKIPGWSPTSSTRFASCIVEASEMSSWLPWDSCQITWK